jgi:hypothetical protein
MKGYLKCKGWFYTTVSVRIPCEELSRQ